MPTNTPKDELHSDECWSATHCGKLGQDDRNLEEHGEKEKETTTASSGHDYEDVLNLIGFGWTQWIVLIAAGLLLMMCINETMGMGIITIASQCDFATNSIDKAVLGAASFVGILFSSYFWGYLSDTIGRRTILIYSTFAGNIFSLISMFIPEFWIFLFLRFVVGTCIAGASSTTYAFLGEFYTTHHRPVVINYASMFVGISMAYVPAVAWLILSMDWSLPVSENFAFRPWRLLIIFNLLPGLIGTLILLGLPESPKYLLSRRKDDEALAAVDWICMRNKRHTLADFKVFKLRGESRNGEENMLTTTKSTSGALQKVWQETVPLFRRPHVLNFLISCTIMCGLFFSSSGMGLWYTEIENRVGANTNMQPLTVCQVIDKSMEHLNDNTTDIICDDNISTKSYIDSITFGLSYIVGYIVLGMVINPLGRKGVMIVALCISAMCGVALHWILEPVVIVVCFCLFLMLPGLCISVLSGALVDLVPTHLRGKAVCICLMLGRSGSVIGSNMVGVLLESYCTLTFSIFSGCVFAIAALTLVLPI